MGGGERTHMYTRRWKPWCCQCLWFVPLLQEDKRNQQYLPSDPEVQDQSLKEGQNSWRVRNCFFLNVLNFFKMHSLPKVCCNLGQIPNHTTLGPRSIISVEGDGGERTENPQAKPTTMQTSRGIPSLQGQPKGKKATPRHLSVTYQAYTLGGDRGGAECLGLESWFTSFVRSRTQQRGTELMRILLFFDVSPYRGRQMRGDGGKEGDGGRERAGPLEAWPCGWLFRVLTGGPLYTGALTSVSMSHCLPTWQKGFPVSVHPLASPNRCH